MSFTKYFTSTSRCRTGIAGTDHDPFVLGITQKERYKRQSENLALNPHIAAYFWDEKNQKMASIHE